VTRESLGDLLAPVNATLNLTSAVLLILGYYFIRSGDRERHRRAMLGALGASGTFLVIYVTRFSLSGTHTFAGTGFAKTIYLSILFSHMVLAVIVLPMVLRIAYLALNDRFHAHKQMARWTFPIWMYVSLTGIAVYVLLYHVYGYV
jgi:putative membrane protein